MSFRAAVLAVTAVVAASPAAAQNLPTPPPDCSAPVYRQLDFWVGEWDVSIKGKQVGTNVITSEEKGCLIHEHWRDAQGGTGQSFNFYNRQDAKWHQVWVSSTGSVLDLAGNYENGRLLYKGKGQRPDGAAVLHELAFSANPDGTVRQHWQISTDGGRTWTVTWDGLYTKKGR